MRLLVACERCKRQFDASGREPGDRFHCSCGTVVTVPEPRPHDASVVRCSSCGGPRQGDAPACSFCGSDFTLHERDLHTVCPGCMARVSDRARFCHHCATPLVPQGSAGEGTEQPCPVCGAEHLLVSRGLGGEDLTVLECGRCGGLWLGKEVFDLLERKARQSARSSTTSAPRIPSAPLVRQEGPLYRPCVECGQMMHRRNYGRKSGVIVDLCHEHGLWFDSGELHQVVRWIEAGGLEQVQLHRQEEERQQERRRRLRELSEPPAGWPRSGWGGAAGGGRLLDFVGEMIDVLAGLR